MNTTPRARKFRISRDTPLAAQQPGGETHDDEETVRNAPAEEAARPTAGPSPERATQTEDGFGPDNFPTAAPDGPQKRVLAPGEKTVAEEIAAIRSEGLTGRQLRMARRLALRHGIEATSDLEAVRLLRRRGIDPFQRSNVLELVVAEAENSQQGGGRVKLPQVMPQKTPAQLDDERRSVEIRRVQRDIARRRKRKLVLMFARLAVFVFLPTVIAGWYFSTVATKLFSTRTEFVLQQADGAAGAVGGLLSGTSFATSQDAITVQSYLQSRDAMLRLDADLGFKAHFSQEGIDPLQRLDPAATNEAAYKVYKRNVKIGYDPTEGIVKMEVIATNPETSEAFSRALFGYAEERVDQLTQRLREDQMKGARESYEDAEAKVLASQDRVLELQEQLGVLDPASETGVIMGQVGSFEGQVQEKRLQLQALLDNESPNKARVEGVRGDIERLENAIAELRASLTVNTGGTSSLAAITGKVRIAEADLHTRQAMLSQAAQQMEVARIEANKQVRYLSMGVSPVAPDEPTYPRVLENTALAFFIFSGIYLMMSLTASILREQVSA